MAAKPQENIYILGLIGTWDVIEYYNACDFGLPLILEAKMYGEYCGCFFITLRKNEPLCLPSHSRNKRAEHRAI